MTIKTRFAPSPTGFIHVGNTRTALICYLMAKSRNGEFMLRMDDTDTERSKEEYVEQIQKDLKWLGINWDIFSRQSERSARYEEIKQKLIAEGKLYACYETPQEIEIKRKMLLNQGKPPIYDRQGLKLSNEQKQEFEKQGRKPHWRFKLDEDKKIAWQDIIKGEISFDAKNLSDPVLIRENGMPTYMLPSAIDDVDFNITHVVRGEDHVSNTAIQIQLFDAIGGKAPQFAHHSLMKTKNGKISKRDGGFDIKTLKENNIEAATITSFLAYLGTSKPIEPCVEIEKLIKDFDLSIFSKAAAIYDEIELERLNPKVLRHYHYNQIKDRKSMEGINIDFWQSIHNNINKLSEVKLWNDICNKQIDPVIDEEDVEFLSDIAKILPDNNWSENTWDEWINNIKKITDRKGKKLFMPIRKALTAIEHGPELKYILPLIGKEKTLNRLTK